MDGDSTQKPNNPIPCANGCGFFGNPLNDNLCSKCYKEIHPKKQEDETSTVKKEETKPEIKPTTTTATANLTTINTTITPTVAATAIVNDTTPSIASTTTTTDNIETTTPEETKKVQTDTTKCFSCNKKVGLLGFKCRCSFVYCSSHRYSDKHDCSFDYKSAGKAALAKANPVVSGTKINKI